MTAIAHPMSTQCPPPGTPRRFTAAELRSVSRWWRRWRSWPVEELQVDADKPPERQGQWFLSIMAPESFWGTPGTSEYRPWGYDIVASEGDTVELVEPDGMQSRVFPNIEAALSEIRPTPEVVVKSTKGRCKAA